MTEFGPGLYWFADLQRDYRFEELTDKYVVSDFQWIVVIYSTTHPTWGLDDCAGRNNSAAPNADCSWILATG